MHSIQSILNDARLVQESTDDANVQSLATLVKHLALRVQDAEALAAANELKLQSAARSADSDAESACV